MSKERYRILLVDDEPDILEFIGYNLISEGYMVEKAHSGTEALKLAKDFKPDLILLDIMMPGLDGIETCELLRKTPETKEVLIAFLTARQEDYSQISGFSAGADDYIIKPVKPKVLASRIHALLKRTRVPASEQNPEAPLRFGILIIDPEKYQITLSGQEILLPRKEFELLILLASKPGRVQFRADIFRSVWGDQNVIGDRTIDVHIRKIRKKIGDHFIKTIKGVGYKFCPQPEE
jgi:two-component system alkaline phosphatase synthesis response regulator PhoP